MRGRNRKILAGAGVILSLALLPSCAFKVKVSESWNSAHRKAIPLGEASLAWESMKRGLAPAPAELECYNGAVRSAVVQIADNWASSNGRGPLLRTTAGEVKLRIDSANVAGLDRVDEIVPADFVRVRWGLKSKSAVDGVGAPLIMRRPRGESDPMIPDSGLWVPATALLNLDRPSEPLLELYDPTVHEGLGLGGARFPLSANYTAAFAREFQDRQFRFQSAGALLRFEEYADRIGLLRVTPFSPSKEPCIFVHGINSSPSTWDEVLNRLYGEAAIRERYEFWTFGYPTGAPIPYMAAELRKAIREMLEFRRSQGAATSRITIVGHSMGGLLARATTFSGGEADWSRLFTVPIGELDLPEAERETLRRMIYFDSIPEVKRVVFCATPHRGSRFAEHPAAKLVGDLIEVPAQLLQLSTTILAQSAHALTPEGYVFSQNRLTSIDQLRSGTWTTAEFLNKPLAPSVRFHSIIGNRRLPRVPLEKAGDGVVPYSSASLEGVESELVVRPSGHSVHQTDAGMEEIARILRLP